MTAGGRIQVQHREEAVGRVRRELLPRLDDLRSIRPRPLERVRRDLADRVRAEEEARDDSEVAAAPTAERPVEIGVLPGVGHDRRSVREDDGRLEQVVAGQPVLPRGQAHAPAEREPSDPHGRTGAGGNRAPVLPEPVVDVDETRTGPDDRPTRRSRARHRSAGRRRRSRRTSRSSRRSCGRPSAERSGRGACEPSGRFAARRPATRRRRWPAACTCRSGCRTGRAPGRTQHRRERPRRHEPVARARRRSRSSPPSQGGPAHRRTASRRRRGPRTCRRGRAALGA